MGVFKLRNENEILNLFNLIVEEDDLIRLSVLEGSRTNENILKDDFQDYDITFFVTDMEFYKRNDDWLNKFGELLFLQKPENMELYPSELGSWYSYLMYFKDGIKIDLTLIPLEEIEHYFSESDGLVKLLIDKDNRISNKIVTSDERYWIKKPSEREFIDCCNEFWSVSTYVAKGLYRKEILYAIDHFNQILRPELLRMMSWKIGLRKGFNFSLGKYYKFIDQHISKEVFDRLLSTFSLVGYKETWQSFQICCDMFRQYSKKVAFELEYHYPDYDVVMTNFIRNIYGKIDQRE